MKARGTYTVKKWEETSYQQISHEMKMTKASVEYAFSGEIEGKASVEYLMFYSRFDPKDQHKSAASYVGLIYFDGTLSGKSGTFVLEDNGTFEGGQRTLHYGSPKAQARVNSRAFTEPGCILPIVKGIVLSWNTISHETWQAGFISIASSPVRFRVV